MVIRAEAAREAAKATVAYLRLSGFIPSQADTRAFEKDLEKKFVRAMVAQELRGVPIENVFGRIEDIAGKLNQIRDTAHRVFSDAR